MEQHRNTRTGETGVQQVNPPTSGFIRHKSYLRKSGSDLATPHDMREAAHSRIALAGSALHEQVHSWTPIRCLKSAQLKAMLNAAVHPGCVVIRYHKNSRSVLKHDASSPGKSQLCATHVCRNTMTCDNYPDHHAISWEWAAVKRDMKFSTHLHSSKFWHCSHLSTEKSFTYRWVMDKEIAGSILVSLTVKSFSLLICQDNPEWIHRAFPTLLMLPEADSRRRLTTAGHTHLHVFLVRCPDGKRSRAQGYARLFRARCLEFWAPFTGCRQQPMARDKLLLAVYNIEVYRVLKFIREKSLALVIARDPRISRVYLATNASDYVEVFNTSCSGRSFDGSSWLFLRKASLEKKLSAPISRATKYETVLAVNIFALLCHRIVMTGLRAIVVSASKLENVPGNNAYILRYRAWNKPFLTMSENSETSVSNARDVLKAVNTLRSAHIYWNLRQIINESPISTTAGTPILSVSVLELNIVLLLQTTPETTLFFTALQDTELENSSGSLPTHILLRAKLELSAIRAQRFSGSFGVYVSCQRLVNVASDEKRAGSGGSGFALSPWRKTLTHNRSSETAVQGEPTPTETSALSRRVHHTSHSLPPSPISLIPIGSPLWPASLLSDVVEDISNGFFVIDVPPEGRRSFSSLAVNQEVIIPGMRTTLAIFWVARYGTTAEEYPYFRTYFRSVRPYRRRLRRMRVERSAYGAAPECNGGVNEKSPVLNPVLFAGRRVVYLLNHRGSEEDLKRPPHTDGSMQMFDTSWRTVVQTSLSSVTADNQCLADIGIFVRKTVESSLQVIELANFSGLYSLVVIKQVP
ncbi:hypothetical protein PR048_010545 [Dryococelus australis]|uniref:Uncharacterized protein n=1 Tax=Dryococelus australis TaxID=614101 RepID=A0ABQ9I3W3_9NEOP|nr:hypothetical protein PR048_010545 [Dryococelus australis]